MYMIVIFFVVLSSAMIGAYCDVNNIVESNVFYWLLGSFTGIIGTFIGIVCSECK